MFLFCFQTILLIVALENYELDLKINRQNLVLLLKIFLFAAVYYIAARLCLDLATINKNVSPVWIPSGIAFGILCLGGMQLLPAVALGAFFANLSIGSSLSVVIPITIGNTLEAMVGINLFWWMMQYQDNLGIHTRTYAFITSAFSATLISALIGAFSLCASGVSSWDEYWAILLTWWTGDTMGALTIFPFLYFFKDKEYRLAFWKYLIIIAAAAFISWLIIYQTSGAPFLFFIFPFIFFCILLTNETGTLLGTISLLIFSIISFKSGSGIFRQGSTNANLVHLQLFLGTLTITGMFLIDFKKFKTLNSIRAVLFGGWLLSGILFATFYKQSILLAETEFNALIEKLEVSINSKMEKNLTALQSGAGLFAAKKDVSHKDWKAFFDQLNLDANLNGLLGVGKITRVPKESMQNFLNNVHKAGRPDFHYKSLGADENKEAYVIELIEPLERNFRALGLDIASEMNRRNAAELSRDSGNAVISDSILLVQDLKKLPGFLMFYPLYSTGLAPTTLPERREHFIGWVYAPVVLQDFFTSVFTQKDFQSLNYVITSPKNPQTILASSLTPNFDKIKNAKELEIKIFNQIYKIKIGKSSVHLTSEDTISSWVAVFAAAMTILIAAFISNSRSLGIKAAMLAEKMTEELRANEELVRKQQVKLALSSKMSSLGEMAGGIAHEINNPLTIINSKALVITKLLEKDKPDLPKIESELKKIEDTTDRIAKIIRGLSAFARNTEGDPMEPAMVSKIIQDTLELCRERFKNHHIELKVNIVDDAIIDCRPHQISQVVLNLLNNAHDAVLNLPEKWINVEVARNNAWVMIKITDSGSGIDPTIIDKIMEPFFTTKEVGKGTGLGLSISKGIIEDHRGQLRYENFKNHTQFVIQLPAVDIEGFEP